MTSFYLWASAIVFTLLCLGSVVPPHKDATVSAIAAAWMASFAAWGWIVIFAR
jgi:hypothetical protein